VIAGTGKKRSFRKTNSCVEKKKNLKVITDKRSGREEKREGLEADVQLRTEARRRCPRGGGEFLKRKKEEGKNSGPWRRGTLRGGEFL